MTSRRRAAKSKRAAAAAPPNPYDTPEYTPDRVYVKVLPSDHNYSPIFEGERVEFGPWFVLPQEISPTPAAFCELWFYDEMLDEWVQATKAYAKSWLPPHRQKDITKVDILHFVSAIYYMGLVRLPSKYNYFNPKGLWPTHHAIRINQHTFQYLWRNFHTTFKTDNEDETEEELDMEANDEVEERENEEEETIENDDNDDRWYGKIGRFGDHVCKVCKKMCQHPGFALTIEEMMKKFKGRSHYTHRMKNKPIKEGYKFFALCDTSTGYIFDFIPDSRGEKGRTILKHVSELVKCIPRRLQLQYFLAMDKFFTTPSVMAVTRLLRVGVIGTARGRSGWPSKEVKEVKDERLNTLHLMNDKENFLIGRLIDNNVVKMVSTIHEGKDTETMLRERQRPRATTTNKANITTVWGKNPTRLIHIPKMIDDYNHWMLGVDKADQYISYYRPNLRCRRTWMPIFLHMLDIIRVNSFIVRKHIMQREGVKVVQKEFAMDLVEAINSRAASLQYASATQQTSAAAARNRTAQAPKRRRMGKKLHLPPKRFEGNKKDHVECVLKNVTQKACIYCSYKRLKDKQEDVDPMHKVSNVTRVCVYCDVRLCAPCFDGYHEDGRADGRHGGD